MCVKHMVSRILVAFDESPQAHAALAFALDTFQDAAIVVLHVSDPRGRMRNRAYWQAESAGGAHDHIHVIRR